MDDNSTENFALGIVVAALLYFIFRKQLDAFAAKNGLAGSNGRGGSSSSVASGSRCGCDSPCSGNKKKLQVLPVNPEISLGGESYSTSSFSSSSVTP